MEHLESALGQMKLSFQKIQPQTELYQAVAAKIKRKQQWRNKLRLLAIILAIFIIATGILLSKISGYHQLGTYFALYVYLFYGFSLMVFVIGVLLNSQKLLLRFLGAHMMKKINAHGCHFTSEEETTQQKIEPVVAVKPLR